MKPAFKYIIDYSIIGKCAEKIEHSYGEAKSESPESTLKAPKHKT